MSEHATRLLVIRHGETAWNLETRIQGHTDIPLNDKGQWQARRVGAALRDEGVAAVYSSDLRRAHDTARAIARATGAPLSLDPSLRERHFGSLEGLTHDDLAAQWPDDARRWKSRDPAYGPPGGETLQAFYDRCVSAIARVAAQHRGQTVALVAHGGVLDCFYRAANGVPLEAPRAWKITNASINRLLAHADGLSLVHWGDERHLDAEVGLDEATDGAVAPA